MYFGGGRWKSDEHEQCDLFLLSIQKCVIYMYNFIKFYSSFFLIIFLFIEKASFIIDFLYAGGMLNLSNERDVIFCIIKFFFTFAIH